MTDLSERIAALCQEDRATTRAHEDRAVEEAVEAITSRREIMPTMNDAHIARIAVRFALGTYRKAAR